jgi:hypothetical protein
MDGIAQDQKKVAFVFGDGEFEMRVWRDHY